MAPPASKEEQVLDALKTLLQGIGTPASSWATAPTVHEGVPGDPLPDVSAGPQLYLEYVRTELRDPFSAVDLDHVRLHYVVYLCAASLRTLMLLKRDVRAAVKGGMSSLTTSFQQPAWLGDFVRDADLLQLKKAGIEAGVQSIFIDLAIAYTTA